MNELHIDFETRSTVELRKAGLWVYAAHPSTDLWCARYSFNDEAEIALWVPGDPCPPRIAAHVQAGGAIWAHNANFERVIWGLILRPRYGWPDFKNNQFFCTAAMCAAMRLPRALEKACVALGLPVQKDTAGHRLMLQMAKPRRIEGGVPVWWDDEARRMRLYDYCGTDVAAERQLARVCYPLSDEERQVWLLDMVINQRGAHIDLDGLRDAEVVISQQTAQYDHRLRLATRGEVPAVTNVESLKRFVRSNWNDPELNTDKLGKDEVRKLLRRSDVPALVRVALDIRLAASKSSLRKVNAALARRCADQRIRDLAMYCGAGTGRWAGMGLQIQNLMRQKFKHFSEILTALDLLRHRDADLLQYLYGDRVLDIIAQCMRSFIIAAPGNELYMGDFKNIESVVLAWLARDSRRIQMFKNYYAGTGPDPYRVAASPVYHKPVDALTAEERQVGKVLELACGYQGWVNAFHSMGKNYGVEVDDEQAAEWISSWRGNNKPIVTLWKTLQGATVAAVLVPGVQTTVAIQDGVSVSFCVIGKFLICRLPSGRCLFYPYPSVKERMRPNGRVEQCVFFWCENQVTRQWSETGLYGGMAAENVTQAIARDLLVNAMFKVEAAGYPIIFHVHDEIVSELPKGQGNLAAFTAAMSDKPAWAAGIPVVVDSHTGERYSKG